MKSVRQEWRVEPGLLYLIPGNNSRSSVNKVTNYGVHYLNDYWLLKKESL